MLQESAPWAVEIVKSFGFPVAVALWFMIRAERKLDDFTRALNELKHAIDNLIAKG